MVHVNTLYCPPTHTRFPRWVVLTWGDPPNPSKGIPWPWWRPKVAWKF